MSDKARWQKMQDMSDICVRQKWKQNARYVWQGQIRRHNYNNEAFCKVIKTVSIVQHATFEKQHGAPARKQHRQHWIDTIREICNQIRILYVLLFLLYVVFSHSQIAMQEFCTKIRGSRPTYSNYHPFYLTHNRPTVRLEIVSRIPLTIYRRYFIYACNSMHARDEGPFRMDMCVFFRKT